MHHVILAVGSNRTVLNYRTKVYFQIRKAELLSTVGFSASRPDQCDIRDPRMHHSISAAGSSLSGPDLLGRSDPPNPPSISTVDLRFNRGSLFAFELKGAR